MLCSNVKQIASFVIKLQNILNNVNCTKITTQGHSLFIVKQTTVIRFTIKSCKSTTVSGIRYQ